MTTDISSTVKKPDNHSNVIELPTYLVLYGPPLSGKSRAVEYFHEQGLALANTEFPHDLGDSHTAIEGIVNPEQYVIFCEEYCDRKAVPLLVLIDAPLHIRMHRAEELGLESDFYIREAKYRKSFSGDPFIPKYRVDNNAGLRKLCDKLYDILAVNCLARDAVSTKSLSKSALAKKAF